MSTTTANFGLVKPELQDPADITATNSNWDKIDEALGKVDLTKDTDKSVKFAIEAGEARKVQNDLIVRFNGGSTEGTDKWTYNGNTSRSINITPEKIKAAPEDHTHPYGEPIKTSGTSEAYTAQVEGITELTAGISFIMIPHISNTTLSPTLNVNNLGAKALRRSLSVNTSGTISLENNWLSSNQPVRVVYDGTYWRVDFPKTSANDLYGIVPIKRGGTGADTLSGLLNNLGIYTMTGTATIFSGFVDGSGIQPYPDGLTKENCVLIGFTYEYSYDVWKTTPLNTLFDYRLFDNGWCICPLKPESTYDEGRLYTDSNTYKYNVAFLKIG